MEVPLNWMNDYSKTHSNLSVFRTNCSSPIHFRVKLEKSRGSNPKKFGNFPASMYSFEKTVGLSSSGIFPVTLNYYYY